MRPVSVKAVCLAVALALTVCGCGLTNPHISWNRELKKDAIVPTLPQALAYADSAKEEYRRALGSQAELASWLGIGLIPLMSAAAGLGVTGGPTTAIAATTMAGVAAFGVGTWLYSKPNQRAWVAGYNATSCAITAVTPLVDASTRSTTIQNHIDALDLKQDAAESAARVVTAKLQAGKSLSPNGEVVLRAEQKIQEAKTQIAAASGTRTNASKLLAQVATSGLVLKEAVDRIAGQVSGALVEAGPDLQALATIVGGLAPTYRQFVAGPESLRPSTAADAAPTPKAQGGEDADEVKAVNDAVAALDAALRDLAVAQRRLGDDVDRLPAGNWFDAVRACGVSPEQVSAPLTLEPAGPITFTKGVPGMEGRIVKGGAPPFAAILQGSLQDLTLTRPEGVFAPSFVVQTSDKTPAGKLTILVTDKPGNRLFVPVTVDGVATKDTKDLKDATRNTAAADDPLLLALKHMRDTIGQGRQLRLSKDVAAIVSKPVVDDAARTLAVDVTLKKGGKDLPKTDAAKIANADLQKLVASLDATVPPASIQIRNKQGAPSTAPTPAPADVGKALQSYAEALKAPATASLPGGLTAVVDDARVNVASQKVTVDVSLKSGGALATPEAATSVTNDVIAQALIAAAKPPASLTVSNLEIGVRRPR